MKAFFDTNVLVYAFLDHGKRQAALEVLSEGGTISAQVLNEFTSVALRRFGRSWDETASAIAVIRFRFPDIMPLDAQTHAEAMALIRQFNFSFYDALVVASALLSECDVLFSEDLQNGLKIGPMMIRNPFAGIG